MTGATVLQARQIRVEYPTKDGYAVGATDCNLSIREGEIVGLVGPSGSGKSTLALALMGLVRRPGQIRDGRVEVDGRDLLALSERQLTAVRGRQIGLITQNPRAALNPLLSIGRQIIDVWRAHNPHTDRRSAKTEAIQMLRTVRINDPERRFDAYPHELSGGMAQRALIAIALVCRPKILIADEPTSGLDVTIQKQILDDLLMSVRATGSAILLITQDLAIVANYCDRVISMEHGTVTKEQSIDELLNRGASETLERPRRGNRRSMHAVSNGRGPVVDESLPQAAAQDG